MDGTGSGSRRSPPLPMDGAPSATTLRRPPLSIRRRRQLHPLAPSVSSPRLDTEISPISTSLVEASHGGHIKEVIAEGPSKRKLAAFDPPTSKRRRSPVVLPIVRSPGVRQMISNVILERSQVAFQERTSNAESQRDRSLSPMAGPLSSPYVVPTQSDAETETRAETQDKESIFSPSLSWSRF
uniref:Uncharacterized protein n=1 Tax=Leersia perrieri TaxID=77586 RepID=A0A0D9X5B3_9ORYZ